jgi:hypothetical protein
MNESLEKQAQCDEEHEDREVVERSHLVHCAYECIWLIDSTNFFISIFFDIFRTRRSDHPGAW